MIRDKSGRAVSLLVLVAACAAIVGAAGADWSFAPRGVAPASTGRATAPSSVGVDRGTALASARPSSKAHPPKRAAAPALRVPLTLPRSLPASMLPAGTHLPTPAPVPGDELTARRPVRLGHIVIPAIGLDQPFFEGVDQAAFAGGVGHWPGSAAPGGWGNAVFGGHRVTHTHPFLNLDRLHAGDEIRLVMANGWSYVYRVGKVFVVPKSAMWIADQAPGRTVTLFTCHPKWSDIERLVVTGVLARVDAPT